MKWLIFQLIFENFKSYYKVEHRSEKLRILANGSSLKKQIESDLNFQVSSDLFVVNEFCKHDLFYKLKPNNYTLADPLYFVQEWMGDSDRETIKILSQVDWEMNLFVPYRLIKQNVFEINNKNIRIIPYHMLAYEGWEGVKTYLLKKGLTMPTAQNVLIPSIFNAIHLGYKHIELFGVDHSWIEEIRVNDKNQVCICDRHFYDDDKPRLIPWNKCEGGVYKMHEILRDLATMFDGYHQLRKFADANHCKIINKTKDSYIDAFERG